MLFKTGNNNKDAWEIDKQALEMFNDDISLDEFRQEFYGSDEFVKAIK